MPQIVITIDESELDADEWEFHREWANNLDITIDELFKRMFMADIDGDPFIEKRPNVGPTRDSQLAP